MCGVEDFVAVHYGDEVFGVGEIDDVVGISREHDDRLYPVAGDFILQHFICPFLSHLYQAVALDDDKLFPFCVVPVLALGDAGLGNIDADLSALGSVDEFGE